MKTVISFLFIIFLIIFLIIKQETAFAGKLWDIKPVDDYSIKAKKLDSKAKILASYLAKFDSPLQYHAQDFIDASSEYDLDWKLLPAIAGVESTFGKHIPGGFNGWGWGVYGNQAIYFNSWREAIFTISKGLRENYLNKGLKDPYAMNRIYAASPIWGSKVTYFMQEIENFAASFEDKTADLALENTPDIAAVSGQPKLALR